VTLRRFTPTRLIIGIVFVLLLALATRPPADSDMWWHLRSGAYMLEHGLIRQDPFSFTRADTVWINHSWGTQFILYGLYQTLGNPGLALYTAFLAVGGMAFVYAASEGNAYLRAFALVLGAATAAVFWSPRPQMISFCLSAAVVYILTLYQRRGIDRLWFLPPLMLVWGNLHAGFSIGYILMAGTLVGELVGAVLNPAVGRWIRVRRLALVSAISFAVLIVNPYGVQLYALPFQTVGIDVLRDYIQEWRPPDFQQLYILPFVVMIVGLIGALGASPLRLRWSDFFLISGTLYLALAAGRNIALFAVVATPLLTLHLNAALDQHGWVLPERNAVPPIQGRLNALLLFLICLGAAAKMIFVLIPVQVQAAQATIAPVAAVEHLKTLDVAGNLFNSYNWGGYLIWAASERRVFVDGRTDLYGNEFLTEYIQTASAQDGWKATLDRYDIDIVLVEVNGSLAEALALTPSWRLEYQDTQAVIYVREGINRDSE